MGWWISGSFLEYQIPAMSSNCLYGKWVFDLLTYFPRRKNKLDFICSSIWKSTQWVEKLMINLQTTLLHWFGTIWGVFHCQRGSRAPRCACHRSGCGVQSWPADRECPHQESVLNHHRHLHLLLPGLIETQPAVTYTSEGHLWHTPCRHCCIWTPNRSWCWQGCEAGTCTR